MWASFSFHVLKEKSVLEHGDVLILQDGNNGLCLKGEIAIEQQASQAVGWMQSCDSHWKNLYC